MLKGQKKWWESSTVAGAVVVLATAVFGLFGVNVDGLSEEIQRVIEGGLLVAGGLVALVGRLRARKQIGE